MRGWSGFPASSNARSKTGPGAQSYGPRPRESKPMLVASTVGAVAGIGPLSSVVVPPNLGGSGTVVRSAPQDVDRDPACGQRRQAVARRPYGSRHACAVDADPG